MHNKYIITATEGATGSKVGRRDLSTVGDSRRERISVRIGLCIPIHTLRGHSENRTGL